MTDFLNVLYMGGEWRDASDGTTFDVLNPSDESILTSAASGTVDDAMACLDSAEAAFGPWAAKSPRERGEILRKAFELSTDRLDDIARATATEYGLVAYIYSGDMRRGLKISERLEFGMIGLNRGLVSDPAAPFGGVKQSGPGREGGEEGRLEFQETQYISTEW